MQDRGVGVPIGQHVDVASLRRHHPRVDHHHGAAREANPPFAALRGGIVLATDGVFPGVRGVAPLRGDWKAYYTAIR